MIITFVNLFIIIVIKKIFILAIILNFKKTNIDFGNFYINN